MHSWRWALARIREGRTPDEVEAAALELEKKEQISWLKSGIKNALDQNRINERIGKLSPEEVHKALTEVMQEYIKPKGFFDRLFGDE